MMAVCSRQHRLQSAEVGCPQQAFVGLFALGSGLGSRASWGLGLRAFGGTCRLKELSQVVKGR